MIFTIVTFHTKQQPFRHGSKVRPLGRLPSVRRRPLGFFVAGIFARVKERKMMSFKLLCRIILPLLRLHIPVRVILLRQLRLHRSMCEVDRYLHPNVN